MAEATANPRTEIGLTRFPSSIARFGDPGGRDRAPDTGLPPAGSREARARWATPAEGAPRGARAAYDGSMQLVFLWRRTAGGTTVSYAGPDRNETLPQSGAALQFRDECESSHPVWTPQFSGSPAHDSAARLGSTPLPDGANSWVAIPC
ncbi:hypothetical protein SY2F82_25390 [Streptomyces sp. Y2F8-2]|nr:hypothetical protein SY2F82_25390 [Streptomyces sp. Y2F8-2]